MTDRNIQEIIVRSTYGQKPDEQYLLLAKQVMHETGVALQPGRWLVNYIPAREFGNTMRACSFLTLVSTVAWLPAWFPGAGFQRWARSAKESFLRMTRDPFAQVKYDMVRCILCNFAGT